MIDRENVDPNSTSDNFHFLCSPAGNRLLRFWDAEGVGIVLREHGSLHRNALPQVFEAWYPIGESHDVDADIPGEVRSQDSSRVFFPMYSLHHRHDSGPENSKDPSPQSSSYSTQEVLLSACREELERNREKWCRTQRARPVKTTPEEEAAILPRSKLAKTIEVKARFVKYIPLRNEEKGTDEYFPLYKDEEIGFRGFCQRVVRESVRLILIKKVRISTTTARRIATRLRARWRTRCGTSRTVSAATCRTDGRRGRRCTISVCGSANSLPDTNFEFIPLTHRHTHIRLQYLTSKGVC